MLNRIIVLCVCLVLPHAATADTIVSFAAGPVTWQASGETNSGFASFPGIPFPPIGTPFTLTLTFNPSAAFPTPTRPLNASHCVAVNVSGSLELGSASYVSSSGLSNLGFTHAQLTGSSCVSAGLGFTQFAFGLTPVNESPWDVRGALLIASYRDLLVQDAFAEVPTGHGLWWLTSPLFGEPRFEVGGPFAPVAVGLEQPALVPEPGTLTLFAIGLAAVARRLRRA